jgi:outer membrane lipoprotein-sorting protein
MANQSNGNERVLARMIREAGDPSIAPDPHYAEMLKATILDRATSSQPVAPVLDNMRGAEAISGATLERVRKMKRIARLALAATIFVTLGIIGSWLAIRGTSANIAFAQVAEVLESLRSATFDLSSTVRGENGHPPVAATGKGFFLAPCHERLETSVDLGNPAAKAAAEAARRTHANDKQAASSAAKAAAEAATKAMEAMPALKLNTIMICDGQAGKGIMLSPSMKFATTMDLKKLRENRKEPAPPDLFEMVRRLVREGNSGTREKPETLGKQQIDGREAIGFRVQVDGMNMTLWADPKTAYPVRIEAIAEMLGNVHVVMNNFSYNVELDSSLFSLEPPPGYSIVAADVAMPTEEDLLRTLRMIAEHNKNAFPAKFAMNQEVMSALMTGLEPKTDKATEGKLDAARKKIEEKYGGREKLRAKYGAQLPSEIMAEMMKSTMSIMQERMQKQMPAMQSEMQTRQRGITFYQMLKPENDLHYVGGGVRLGTPDRPILWYKPTGANKYHVVYADLSVKELTSERVKQLPAAKLQ